jgi:hypothetical protein
MQSKSVGPSRSSQHEGDYSLPFGRGFLHRSNVPGKTSEKIVAHIGLLDSMVSNCGRTDSYQRG